MDLYTETSYSLATDLTRRYSSSFSLASRLFPATMQQHIYAIYGLVRIADEIVDTYHGDDQAALLTATEAEVYAAIERGFSVNPIIHAFQGTAALFAIGKTEIEPFFASMRTDITRRAYDQAAYDAYIYGSAEVVGLMCLRVFVAGETEQFNQLRAGACKLGAAYQKVNFLRDLAADHNELGRYYFPIGSFAAFDDTIKRAIIADISEDFKAAYPAIKALPAPVRPAVLASYRYYMSLLSKLSVTPAAIIKTQRIRIPNAKKIVILAKTAAMERR